jgi:nickel/cobalt exporter
VLSLRVRLSSDSGGARAQGICAIRLDLAAEAALGTAGEHQLSFRNDHLPELGVYLVNALVPTTSEIKISGQARDPLQREMRLSFHVTPCGHT